MIKNKEFNILNKELEISRIMLGTICQTLYYHCKVRRRNQKLAVSDFNSNLKILKLRIRQKFENCDRNCSKYLGISYDCRSFKLRAHSVPITVQVPYSQRSIFFVTYESAQSARLIHNTMLERLTSDKCSNLLGC